MRLPVNVEAHGNRLVQLIPPTRDDQPGTYREIGIIPDAEECEYVALALNNVEGLGKHELETEFLGVAMDLFPALLTAFQQSKALLPTDVFDQLCEDLLAEYQVVLSENTQLIERTLPTLAARIATLDAEDKQFHVAPPLGLEP